MVNKYEVLTSNTWKTLNYDIEKGKKIAFRLPSKKDLKEWWMRFLNGKDLKPDVSYIYICKHSIKEKYLNRKSYNNDVFWSDTDGFSIMIAPRKPPFKRIFQEDKLNSSASYKPGQAWSIPIHPWGPKTPL